MSGSADVGRRPTRPPLLPPRRPLCRTCDDTGVVVRRGGLSTDACPDCTRAAEARWQGAHRPAATAEGRTP